MQQGQHVTLHHAGLGHLGLGQCRLGPHVAERDQKRVKLCDPVQRCLHHFDRRYGLGTNQGAKFNSGKICKHCGSALQLDE